MLRQLLKGECDGDVIGWGEENERYLDEDGQRIEYRDWAVETTKVVSGPYGQNSFPGRWFSDRAKARRYWLMKAGHIIQEWFIPGRYIFRVSR